jgi:hypothetical protein
MDLPDRIPFLLPECKNADFTTFLSDKLNAFEQEAWAISESIHSRYYYCERRIHRCFDMTSTTGKQRLLGSV